MLFKSKKNILRQPKIYSAPKDQEPKRVPRYLKFILLIVIVIIGLAYLLFFSPIFKIRTIDLVGAPSNDSLTYLETFKGINIFRINTALITEELQKQNPEFQSVKVSCGIPKILRVAFTERQPSVVWQSGGKYYLVDDSAIAYKQVDQPPADLILVVDKQSMSVDLPEQIASGNFINFLKDVKTKISSLDLQIKQFEINETIFQVDAIMTNNIKIIFDTTRSSTDQIDAAALVYKDHKAEISQYMDIRVEGKVYYQ